jgi:flagellar hook-associated protein 1
MSTISGIVNSALSALNTYQVAIDVTNTNIANTETTGYSRQRAVIQTKDSVSITSGTIGGGVTISKIERIYDSFLTSQLRSANEDYGKWEAETETLSSIEEVFSDTDDSGLSSALSDFWNGWQDVVNDPSDSSARSVLASAADSLADTFNSMSSDLSGIQQDIDDSVVETVNSINDLVQQIADANQKIAQADASGINTNTCKDTLDSLMLELSSLVDISTYTNGTGQTCVRLADGKPLVEGTATWSLSTETNSTTGLKDITWVDSSGDSLVVTDDISSGKLGGYLEVRDDVIPAYQDKLDELAASIMEQVDTLHTGGYDLDGESGVTFFSGTGATDMVLNSEILDDPGKIAASATTDGAPDDGSNAAAIAELQDSLVLNSGTSTFSDYYASMVRDIGSTVSSAEAKYSTQSDLVEFCENQRASVSGVSQDEEMAKLVLYQNAYSSAAKVITILDEMLQTLIDM